MNTNRNIIRIHFLIFFFLCSVPPFGLPFPLPLLDRGHRGPGHFPPHGDKAGPPSWPPRGAADLELEREREKEREREIDRHLEKERERELQRLADKEREEKEREAEKNIDVLNDDHIHDKDSSSSLSPEDKHDHSSPSSGERPSQITRCAMISQSHLDQ